MKRLEKFYYPLTMRKWIFIFFSMLVFSPVLTAQQNGTDAAENLKKIFSSVPKDQQNYWQHKFLINTPLTSQVQAEAGAWNVLKDWVNGQEKQRYVQAVADYLFNMYVSTTAQGYIPLVLNLNFAGVLDPFENLPTGYKTGNLLSLYYAEKEQIQKHLSQRFQTAFGIEYSANNPANKKTEDAFLKVLANSYRLGDRVGYKGQTDVFPQVQEHLKKEIAKSFHC